MQTENDNEVWKAKGWLVKFDQVDLDNDLFDQRTNFHFDKSMRLPILFAHGADPLLRLAKLGEGVVSKETGGLWIEATLQTHGLIGAALRRLSRDSLLGWSSGAAGHGVARQKGKVNHIKSWMLAEASLVVAPAMPLPFSKVYLKRWSYEQAALEIAARLAINRYERIAEQIERGNRNVAI